MQEAKRIAVTILTGFLGAGKSTLLRRVLTEQHGRKIAVIENEFAEENIDSEIIVAGGDERIIQLTNGCLCCGIRDDLRATLTDLAVRRTRGEIDFDQVMIETTGLADPAPIAQTFFLDAEVAASYRPDAVLTLVDAKHAMNQLDTRSEARRQVGFADRLFITKTDLVSPDELDALRTRLTRMNSRAAQRVTSFGDAPLEEVFDVGGFNLSGELDITEANDSHGHRHDHPACGEAAECRHHHYDDDVKSFVFRTDQALDVVRFNRFMGTLIQAYGTALLRYKGVLQIAGLDRKVILQGVHQLMSHDLGQPWDESLPRESKLVFIGIDLPQRNIAWGLEHCLAAA
jgi:G3E family GTPase